MAGIAAAELAALQAAGVVGDSHVELTPPEELKARLVFLLEQIVEQGALRAVEPDHLAQLDLDGSPDSSWTADHGEFG